MSVIARAWWPKWSKWRHRTRIAMGDGCIFVVPWSYRKTKRKFGRGLRERLLIEIPGQGRRVFLNAKQMVCLMEDR